MRRLLVLPFLLLFVTSISIISFADKEYDALEKLFMNIDKDTDYENALNMIIESGLSYSEDKHNSSYGKIKTIVVGYDEDTARDTYAESGDRLELEFLAKDNSLLNMLYSKEGIAKSALLYSYGTWFDFNEKEPKNNYSGLYLIDYLNNKKGIVITYKNGNTKETNYFKYSDKEELLSSLY